MVEKANALNRRSSPVTESTAAESCQEESKVVPKSKADMTLEERVARALGGT